MALSNDNTTYRTRAAGTENVSPKSGVTVYQDALLAAGSQQNGTAANIGRVYGWTNAAGNIPFGFFQPHYTYASQGPGITGNSAGTVTSEADCTSSVKLLPVTGLAGTIAGDRYKPVYATDDATFTLTRPSAPTVPIGWVVQEYSDTSAFVEVFNSESQAILAMSGGDVQEMIVTIAPVLAASGKMLSDIKAPCHGKILEVYATCLRAPTDADVDIDVNVEIGGTNVTGGVVELIHGDAPGDNKAGTSVSAANVFHQGDLIDIEGVVNTAGTATDVGTYNLHIRYQRLFGL